MRVLSAALLLISPLMTLSGCSSVFYHPDRLFHVSPDKLGLEPQEVSITAKDGTQLHAWYIQPEAKGSQPPKGTIVQFHGNAQNLTSHYYSLAWLVKEGYALFTFDYRGYGRSQGEPSQEGTHLDGLAALDQAWELHQKSKAKKFIVYGQSLGGVIAARAFSDFAHRDETSLLVMDSTFSSYKDVAQQKLSEVWLTFLLSPLGRLAVSDEFASKDKIPDFQTRILVIHDRKDPVVSFKNGNKIFELATGPRDFWELDRGGHVAVFAHDTPENRERFLLYLAQVKN